MGTAVSPPCLHVPGQATMQAALPLTAQTMSPLMPVHCLPTW